jgi:hypothetical protein
MRLSRGLCTRPRAARSVRSRTLAVCIITTNVAQPEIAPAATHRLSALWRVGRPRRIHTQCGSTQIGHTRGVQSSRDDRVGVTDRGPRGLSHADGVSGRNSWVYEHTRSRGVPRSEPLPHVKIGKYVRFDARLVRGFLLKRTRMG